MSKSGKRKNISLEIVPSDWDRSSDAETKSDKPKASVSAAPPLHKTSTGSDPFKTDQLAKPRQASATESSPFL
ncbi:hypothetical protein PGT21_014802 [Puccinia graminis f. sp. tritici]|uniref:Uncharacterized protein n=1 Tax=Puccinia graminis f. sp. tritici TaxID=56615 RepID=A0A5B0N214_PUCGR|nr:hypothetical protein PGTUg99_021518 [Puccinia graminis f. sp. tritici]KAA1094243.1 hypothetical protein PGT21_014802 [Puccinia graminis f. sp. tritici]